MKKSNTAVTAADQQRVAAKRARRDRRKAKRAAIVERKLRPLLLLVGQLKAENETLRNQQKVASAASALTKSEGGDDNVHD